ncbi:MAG TPA: cysteine--tRNA ligase [Acidimicrobiales bacterium]|nr:cysteine--tRNA ligase [Acidimicrobiales bacterium]
MLRLHDTALGEVVDIEPAQPGRFSMYVCGLTVYDVPHIGHGRAALVYDLLRRYLEWTGVDVHHVSNVTDIDDNIIQRAEREGRSSTEVAEQYERAWWDAVDRLGVLRPHDIPHATEYVERMVELIGQLFERGYAYQAPDGVYFATEALDGYGLLAGQPLESLRAGARVESDESKRSPTDFALWKLSKPGEPWWESPWGKGRPGWHTECVVMSLDLLGDGFDLHAGGLDLKFPHHENERAQAVALGKKFTRHWMHHAFVEVAGEKMSKSLGNFTSLTDLLARTDARAYRLLVLQSHYRSPMEVTVSTVDQAVRGLTGLDTFALRFRDAFDDADAAALASRADAEELARFRQRMDDDLDTPPVTGQLFDLIRRGNAAADTGGGEDAERIAATVATVAGALGLAPYLTGDVPADVVAACARIDEARAQRDFATADAIRAELSAGGWIVENSPTGTRVRQAPTP